MDLENLYKKHAPNMIRNLDKDYNFDRQNPTFKWRQIATMKCITNYNY